MTNMKDWRVLIVEDDPDGQQVVSDILSFFDIQTDVTDTAEVGLNLLKERDYHMVIIDIGLPGMDGLEMVERMAEDDATYKIPTIAITAFHTTALKKKALDVGFISYFAKPLDETSFIREVERILT